MWYYDRTKGGTYHPLTDKVRIRWDRYHKLWTLSFGGMTVLWVLGRWHVLSGYTITPISGKITFVPELFKLLYTDLAQEDLEGRSALESRLLSNRTKRDSINSNARSYILIAILRVVKKTGEDLLKKLKFFWNNLK
jgi:hypothetical protein